MKQLILLMLALVLVGCEAIKLKNESIAIEQTREGSGYTLSGEQQQKLLSQILEGQNTLLLNEQQEGHLPPIGVVLQYEQIICKQSREQRTKRLDQLQKKAEFAAQFEVLILASCAPDFTPSVLARSLKIVESKREWPADYQAYFDVLSRHLGALERLEKLYGNLKKKMNTTIDKLTEIEVQTQP